MMPNRNGYEEERYHFKLIHAVKKRVCVRIPREKENKGEIEPCYKKRKEKR